MALAKINGRQFFVDVDSVAIAPVSNGRWAVTFDQDREFIVVGGRKSGGAAHEWFCYRPEMFGETWVQCKSMVAAVKLGCCY